MSTNTTINGKDYYRLTKTIGHKYQDGKKIPVKKQFYGTSKRDAEAKYNEWYKAQVKNENIKDTVTTFGAALATYVSTVLKVNAKYSVGTRELYETAYKTHLKDNEITNIILSKLQASDLQRFYNDLDCTHSALNTLTKFVNGFFKWAAANEYCRNITTNVVLPEKTVIKKQEDIITWTDEELERILDPKYNYYQRDLLVFAAYTGMRISELLGLKWGDIDDTGIHVRRQFYRGIWTPPKNHKERVIPIHEKIKEIVDATGDHNPDDLVFTTSIGTPLDYHNLVRSLGRYYNRIEVKMKKFHAYRATFVSNLCKQGVPIQVVSKIAGHANINVTAKYYTAIEMEQMEKAVMKL